MHVSIHRSASLRCPVLKVNNCYVITFHSLAYSDSLVGIFLGMSNKQKNWTFSLLQQTKPWLKIMAAGYCSVDLKVWSPIRWLVQAQTKTENNESTWLQCQLVRLARLCDNVCLTSRISHSLNFQTTQVYSPVNKIDQVTIQVFKKKCSLLLLDCCIQITLNCCLEIFLLIRVCHILKLKICKINASRLIYQVIRNCRLIGSGSLILNCI